jgi:hypothetical protein
VRRLLLAILPLYLATDALAQGCADYRSSVYTNHYGVNVTFSGFTQSTVQAAFQMWNGGCRFGGGTTYPLFDFDQSLTGRITVQYLPGHRSDPIPDGSGEYPRGEWDPNTRTITIWEEAGQPSNFVLWSSYPEDRKQLTLAHEFGHALGLRDDACFGGVMNSPPPAGAGVTPDECTAADRASHVPYEGTKYAGCQDLEECHMSPIVIDLARDKIELTDIAHGVRFDLDGDGRMESTSWTKTDSDTAFLWIDKNDNGVVDNGTELFGSAMDENGFAALANFDQRDEADIAWGGNADGIIDEHDRVWKYLRLWVDRNHDGICQPDEVYSLAEKGVRGIHLNYNASGKHDRYGNLFRYSALVDMESNGHRVSTKAYDIFFAIQP